MSQTLQRVGDVDLGSVGFWLVKQGQHPEIILIFTPLFLVYLHHPCACSIIPRVGLSGPRAPKQKRASKFECRRQIAWLHAKRHVCLPLWPPWTMATTSTCVLVVQALGPRLGPAWSPLGLCALAPQPGGLRLSQIWATHVEACDNCWHECPHKGGPLLHGDNDHGTQLHLALQ